MKLIALTIFQFKSFTRERTFHFPQAPGLYFLTGRNDVNPRLGANGVGKSTVWDALFWLFFEKTPAGLKAGDVAPWKGGGGTKVTLQYEHGGKTYVACRTWKPNKWWLECEGESQTLVNDSSNLLLAHLGTGADPFLHSVLMAQGQEMFLDLKSEAMSSLFGKVLNLDGWVDLSAKASKAASVQDTITRGLESKTAHLEGELSGLKKTESLDFDAWEQDRQQHIDRYEQDLGAIAESLQKLESDERTLRGLESRISRRVADADAVTLGNRKKLEQLKAEEQSCQKDVTREENEERSLDKQWHDANKSTECDACHRAWSPAQKTERLKELEHKLDVCASAKARAARTLDEVRMDVDDAQRVFLTSQKAGDDLYSELLDVQDKLKKLEWDLSSVRKSKHTAEQELSHWKNRQNPMKSAMQEQKARRHALEDELSLSLGRLADSQEQYLLKQFWVKGFKEIRLQEISEALTQLELEVNSGITQLGLPAWEVHFDSDMETSRGAIKRGFTVKVLSPDNDTSVPWRAWSGGEAQRLRLGGNMGLSDLVRGRLGVSLALEVWDEPTQFLSPQGVTDLLDALKRRAEEHQRQIWVVDHRSLGYGAFDGVVTVVKDRSGSRFEISDRIVS